MPRLGIDVGGTFVDLVLATDDDTLFFEKVLAEPADLVGSILGGVDALLGRAGIAGGAVGSRPCDDAGLQHGPRAQRARHCARRHPRLQRCAPDPAGTPLEHVRRPAREARSPRAPLAQLRGHRAHARRRLRSDSAGRARGQAGRSRHPASRRQRGRGRVPPLLRQPRPRAPSRGDPHGSTARGDGNRLERRSRCRRASTSARTRPLSTPTSPARLGLSGGARRGHSRRRACRPRSGSCSRAAGWRRWPRRSHVPCARSSPGPAAGVVGATSFGAAVGHEDVISFDMGGTTAKAAVVSGGARGHDELL